MGLKSVWKEIRRSLTTWTPIYRFNEATKHHRDEHFPRWIQKSILGLRSRPYDKVLYFKGKHHLYKVECICMGQAQIDYTLYVKKRIR